MTKRPPAPQEIAAQLTEIRHLTLLVRSEYRWAMSFAYGSTRRTGIGGGSASAEPSDAASGPVVSEHKEKVRERMATARELVEDALSNLRAAAKALERGFGKQEHERGAFPRTATKAERAEAQEAQRRRMARGEGWGEA